MTILELIEFLETLDKSLLICTVGHFGEVYPMDRYNFTIYTLGDKKTRVLNVETPYIGEAPD